MDFPSLPPGGNQRLVTVRHADDIDCGFTLPICLVIAGFLMAREYFTQQLRIGPAKHALIGKSPLPAISMN
jgi:hypothetical protein